MNRVKKYLRILLELGKVRITSFVALSTSVGFILYEGTLTFIMILPIFGVFLLASGSSAINHYQERNTDALMDRTKNRPIPSGRISESTALLISMIIVLLGSLVLYFSSNLTSLLLGLLALIWYNFFYTPLKRRFAFAVIPGSLIGAIPPIIGWTASGGDPFNIKILSIAIFFFIWQIPHFWLLLMIHKKDYEKAGFPTLSKKYNDYQLGRITFVWIVLLAASCVLIPIFVSSNFFSLLLIIVFGAVLLFTTKEILTEYIEKIIIRKAFIMVNLYVLAVAFLISIDKLIFQEL